MSSFKRRVAIASIPGTKPSPYNSFPLLSTGLTSLDDLLGGGLPLSSTLLLEADSHTSYADLLLKFWIAQGLECKQDVVVVATGIEGGPQEVVRTLMGVDGGEVGGARAAANDEDEDGEQVTAEKLKIAFRYEGMKQHKVTAPTPTRSNDTETYCSMFDLTTKMPIRAGEQARLHLIDVEEIASSSPLPSDLYEALYERLATLITERGYSLPQDATQPRKALRLAFSSFGSPSWGPTSSSSLYKFLHRLRTLLRHSSASAILTFPAHLYRASDPSLLTRLEHASDGIIELESFASSPLSLAAFPRHNGILRIPKLPSLGSLLPPSAKLSVLRGMGGSAGGDNNLGFRVKRRRFVIETVNGDGPTETNSEVKKPVPVLIQPVPVTEKTKQEGNEVRTTKVRFAGEEEEREKGERKKVVVKPRSVAATIHTQPELYEF